MFLLFLIILTLFLASALSGVQDEPYIDISTASGLLYLSNEVNSGTSYSGTAIRLGDDIDLNGISFEPIGNSINNLFMGVFDGQGHTIKNLGIENRDALGLFGYSKGATIKAVTLESLSVICNTDNTPFVSGVVGVCISDGYNLCSIEDVVIKDFEVSFSGKNKESLFMGGIGGLVQGYVERCTAEDGSIVFSGASESAYIGGVVGYLSGDPELSSCSCSECTTKNVNKPEESSKYSVGEIYGMCENGELPLPSLISSSSSGSSSSSSSLPSLSHSSSSSLSRSIYSVFSSASSSSSSSSSSISSLSLTTPILSEYVEIVFDKKDLTEKDVINIIKEIIGNNGKFVIVKFSDVEEAKNFIEAIEKSSGKTRYNIKGVVFANGIGSFSYMASPLTSLMAVLFL